MGGPSQPRTLTREPTGSSYNKKRVQPVFMARKLSSKTEHGSSKGPNLRKRLPKSQKPRGPQVAKPKNRSQFII